MPAIDWYHCQGSSAAPTRAVRYQTNGTLFLQSVTLEPTVLSLPRIGSLTLKTSVSSLLFSDRQTQKNVFQSVPDNVLCFLDSMC